MGNYTSIAPYVQMLISVQHACIQDRNLVSTYQLGGYPKSSVENKIIIGSDVWIGQNVILLGGVTIGHGAIIGAFSVVAKDIPAFAVVVGNPAVIKRYRFTEEQIEKLLKISWWTWPEEKMEENKEDFLDIDVFITKHML